MRLTSKAPPNRQAMAKTNHALSEKKSPRRAPKIAIKKGNVKRRPPIASKKRIIGFLVRKFPVSKRWIRTPAVMACLRPGIERVKPGPPGPSAITRPALQGGGSILTWPFFGQMGFILLNAHKVLLSLKNYSYSLSENTLRSFKLRRLSYLAGDCFPALSSTQCGTRSAKNASQRHIERDHINFRIDN